MKKALLSQFWLLGVLSCFMVQAEVSQSQGRVVAPPKSGMTQTRLAELTAVYQQKRAILPTSYGPSGDTVHVNALLMENSPYLLRHGTNPINWQAWSVDVFNQAKMQNKLVFLSVGYSTCHWCHVMESDSFVKEDIALLLNQHFIAVKVDRETLPAVDELYTNALTQVTGSSGWPISAVLNEKGEPVFIDAFITHDKLKVLLTRLSQMWQSSPDYLNQNAANVMSLVKADQSVNPAVNWDDKALQQTVTKVQNLLDPTHGGFAGEPKFPSESMILFLLDSLKRKDNEPLAQLVERQLDQMVAKGLLDAVNGGFHRYSTDEQWLVPHYEKMLYNQGQLLMVYVQGARIYGKPRYKAVVKDTIQFIQHWLHQPGIGLHSAIDADFKGQDGLYYLRTAQQLKAISAKQVTASGMKTYPFEHGDRFGVYFTEPQSTAAQQVRAILAEQQEVRPHIDRKIITAWNALTIWGLADAYQLLADDSIKQMALELAQSLWQRHFNSQKQQLSRSSYNNDLNDRGTLADYAFFAKALLRLYDISEDKKWLDNAKLLVDIALEKFKDNDQGFLFSEISDSAGLAVNLRKNKDSELLPAGAVMVEVIQDLWLRSGEVRYKKQAKLSTADLKRRFSEDSLNHLYAGMVINKLDHRNMSSKQYFAIAKGQVELTANAGGDNICSSSKNVVLKVNLQSGWHVNSATPIQSYLRPTKVTFAAHHDVYKIDYPQPQRVQLGFQKAPLSVYERDFELKLNKKQNTNQPVRFTVDLQACSDSVCLLPEKLSFYLPKCG